MKKYEEYIQVDLPWLSEIPSHWYTQRAKAMFNKEKREVREYDDVITCFRDGVVTLRKNRRTTGFTESIQESGYQGIRAGDLIIHQMDAFAGATGVSDSDGKGTPVYSVCTPKGEYNNYYYAHIVREMAKTGFIQSLYRGIRERSSDFRFDVFGKQYLPIPTNEEQTQIVKYLDWKVAKINKYIKAKKRQIELLKELKQAEINRAFDSESLRYTRLKYLAQSQVSSISRIYPENGLDAKICHYPIAYNNKSINGRTTFEKGKCSENDLKKYKLYAEDVVITKDSESSEDIGVPSFITEEIDNCVCGYHLAFLRVFDREIIYPKYLYYSLLRSNVAEYYVLKCNGITRFGLNSSIIGNIKVPVIELSLQKKVINYLDDFNNIIDPSLSNINFQIDRISEYKTRLISDVVTGKVDVREVVVPENYEVESIAEDIKDDGEVLETIN